MFCSKEDIYGDTIQIKLKNMVYQKFSPVTGHLNKTEMFLALIVVFLPELNAYDQ